MEVDTVIDVYFEDEIIILVDGSNDLNQEQVWEILETNSIGFTGISKAGG